MSASQSSRGMVWGGVTFEDLGMTHQQWLEIEYETIDASCVGWREWLGGWVGCCVDMVVWGGMSTR